MDYQCSMGENISELFHDDREKTTTLKNMEGPEILKSLRSLLQKMNMNKAAGPCVIITEML